MSCWSRYPTVRQPKSARNEFRCLDGDGEPVAYRCDNRKIVFLYGVWTVALFVETFEEHSPSPRPRL
jgi:hypothetical protein